jgi:hypothetical protein
MIKNSILFIAALFLFSCSGKKNEESNLVFDKLVGTWRLAEEDQFEEWKKNEDGTYSSRMYSVTEADTNVMEEVKVVAESGKWNFVTQVKGQNKGKAITFTSTVLQDTLVQFENPTHDFPRIINYRLATENDLQAFIAGTTDTIYFNYTRIIGK